MEVHIGQKIEQTVQDSGLKISEFAKRMNTSPRNIYSIFKRKTITVDMLKEIGEVLNKNFFEFYGEQVNNRVEEPAVKYPQFNSNRVQMIVELNGDESTLENIINTLRKLNSSLA
jgi:transcriptional regulator with XRE-family HTH domain